MRQAFERSGLAVEWSIVHWRSGAQRELRAIGNGRHAVGLILIERGVVSDDMIAVLQLRAERPRLLRIPAIIFTAA